MRSSKTFSLNIENIVKEKRITHMEAVLWYCKDQGIEPDTVSNLLTKGLKEKIEANARDLNFLPKRAQLPIQEIYDGYIISVSTFWWSICSRQ